MDLASRLPAKSLEEQTKTRPGQAKFKRDLSLEQAGSQVFQALLSIVCKSTSSFKMTEFLQKALIEETF